MLTNVKIYRVNGDEAEMPSIDARRAVKEHPSEWSYEPWTREQQQEALEKSLQADIDALDT
ncbi:hypothetical protein [Agrobacterium pusense]|uniref:Uncharacterized protein n=1 Tax=Agrobacterium pusense TaxID=648995 RepID=A0AA44EQ47_9HYPH|nr:hypothetical protein [Agrobacterium pusense]NRF12284.1 hypothetical protein [Agrobacterium pusense]NRF22994.1 hypothetical protein [Agrobacterium pusense]